MPHGHGASIWAVFERFRRIYDERHCFLRSCGAPANFVLGGASFDSRHVGCDHWVVLMGLNGVDFVDLSIGATLVLTALSMFLLALAAALSVLFGCGGCVV